VIGAGASVNGSALVFCGRDMWFLDGRNVCAIFLCTYSFGVIIQWSRFGWDTVALLPRSTAPQLRISQKALGKLPDNGYVMPKHVGATIHN
jgi:hypothetical protein